MPMWPSTLPQQQFRDLSDQAQDATVRFVPDAGPPKGRRRFRGRRTLTTPIALTGAQRKAFDTFYHTTLREGSLEFDWTDPVDDTTVSFFFLSPPQFVMFVGNADTDRRKWIGTLELMVTT